MLTLPRLTIKLIFDASRLCILYINMYIGYVLLEAIVTPQGNGSLLSIVHPHGLVVWVLPGGNVSGIVGGDGQRASK